MTSNQQRAALQRQIWAIANDVRSRGSVDGWDLSKHIMSSVLKTLFYRFISENFALYIEAIQTTTESFYYAKLSDDRMTI